MAIALQDGLYVWLKVAKALAGANPANAAAFRELKTYIATQGGNPQLQFVPFTAEQITTNHGYSPDVDANTLYGVYLKGRRTSGTTSSFVTVHAATTGDASTTSVVTFRFKAVGQSYALVAPTGIAIETELAIEADTAVAGGTESTTADAADGFVVIGA